MAENTKIEWADHTFNPWIGCTQVSPGCDNCYAKAWDRRFAVSGHAIRWGAGQPRSRTKTWGDPVKWNKQPFYECLSCGWRGCEKDSKACEHGHDYSHRHCPNCNTTESLSPARARVFCASLADVFDNEVPPEWRHDLFNLIAATPELDWLLLTKRPQNIVRMVQDHGCVAGNGTRYLPRNVWLGTTAEDQKHADINVPALLEAREQTGAGKTFISMEPLLGPVDLRHLNKDRETNEFDSLKPELWEAEVERWRNTTDTWEEDFLDWYGTSVSDASGPMHQGIDWVFVGGESGPNARPMHPAWVRSLRDQCLSAGVPFLFKQWGNWSPVRSDIEILDSTIDHKFDDGTWMEHVGKKQDAGRMLDGRTWDGVPV